MKILVFAPHNDDEVLGVGGTIAKYAREGHDVYICEVTSVKDEKFLSEIQSEALEAHKILGVKETIFLGLPVVELKNLSVKEINSKIQKVVDKIKPNIAYIPFKGDMHIDHFEVAQSAMVALRPHVNNQLKEIYAYETLSETEWSAPTIDNIFIPNVWSDITETIDLKLKAMNCFKSQIQEFSHPRSIKAIEVLSNYRGSNVCLSNAESFMLIRKIF